MNYGIYSLENKDRINDPTGIHRHRGGRSRLLHPSAMRLTWQYNPSGEFPSAIPASHPSVSCFAHGKLGIATMPFRISSPFADLRRLLWPLHASKIKPEWQYRSSSGFSGFSHAPTLLWPTTILSKSLFFAYFHQRMDLQAVRSFPIHISSPRCAVHAFDDMHSSGRTAACSLSLPSWLPWVWLWGFEWAPLRWVHISL